MNKLLYGALTAACVFGLASCSNDEPAPQQTQSDATVFNIKLPGNLTRGTFGDGTGAGDRASLNNLQWTVYEIDAAGNAKFAFTGQKQNAFSVSKNEESVSIPLAKGKTYQVSFYADDADNNFVTYDAAAGTLNVDYINYERASNVVAHDAFIGNSTPVTVTGGFTQSVTLTRPFAQLNWGTADLNEPAVQAFVSNLTASVSLTRGLYRTLNVLTGAVSNEVTGLVKFKEVQFDRLPSQTFPVNGYTLIAMNYLLVGNEGVVDCKLSFNEDLLPVSVSSAPVKMNYRTNIYGNLLTTPGMFNIIVDNAFILPDIDITAD